MFLGKYIKPSDLEVEFIMKKSEAGVIQPHFFYAIFLYFTCWMNRKRAAKPIAPRAKPEIKPIQYPKAPISVNFAKK